MPWYLVLVSPAHVLRWRKVLSSLVGTDHGKVRQKDRAADQKATLSHTGAPGHATARMRQMTRIDILIT